MIPIHSLVIKSASAPDIREVALEEGMSTLQGSGWNQIKRGLTTIEEVIRYADGFVEERVICTVRLVLSRISETNFLWPDLAMLQLTSKGKTLPGEISASDARKLGKN